MEGLEQRVTKLEACMKCIHRILDAQERVLRSEGRYIDADLCEHCKFIIEDYRD